jgi:hypothetical protein
VDIYYKVLVYAIMEAEKSHKTEDARKICGVIQISKSQRWAGGEAQGVECLPSKCKAMSSNTSTSKSPYNAYIHSYIYIYIHTNTQTYTHIYTYI